MQFVQLPKLALRFRKVYNISPLAVACSNIDKNRLNFNAMIPEKVLKQDFRIRRSQEKECASDVNLRDGGVLKMSSLLNMKTIKNDFRASNKNDSTNNSHSIRLVRIESNIHAELINFFASESVPKILRSDYALWSMVKVNAYIVSR